MTALDFGLLIHSTPRGGTVPDMAATNERILQAAVEHDLSVWVVDRVPQAGCVPAPWLCPHPAATRERYGRHPRAASLWNGRLSGPDLSPCDPAFEMARGAVSA